jgi:hypothetical protein
VPPAESLSARSEEMSAVSMSAVVSVALLM